MSTVRQENLTEIRALRFVDWIAAPGSVVVLTGFAP